MDDEAMTTNNTDGAALLPVTPELLPCPFCWTSAHLSYQWPGSMTADMPDRPCRVICSHIDHDTVVGPTGYGKRAAITAWNTRRQSHSLPGDVGAVQRLYDKWVYNLDWLQGRKEADDLTDFGDGRLSYATEIVADLRAVLESAALTPSPCPGDGMPAWRTIDSAPTDGQTILAICASAYTPTAFDTWWQDGWTHYSRPDDKWHGGVGKWFPTHWMPREAYLAALTPSALSPEPVQKVHELPEGHRWCRHCEQKDPHCSVCEGVGYLPSALSGDAGEG